MLSFVGHNLGSKAKGFKFIEQYKFFSAFRFVYLVYFSGCFEFKRTLRRSILGWE